MELRKVVISLFLLLTYSVGFAHHLVPHSTVNSNNSHSHQHISIDDSNIANYISHGSHFDTSLYDLIICALADTDHGEENCNLEEYLSPKTNFSNENIIIAQFVAILYTFLNDDTLDEPIANYNVGLTVYFTSPLLEHSPHRGPPTTSC